MHRLVPGAFTLKHGSILLRGTFDENGHGLALETSVEIECRVLDGLHQAIEAVEDNLMRRRVINLRGGRTGTLGVDECERLGKTDALRKRKRLKKILFSFPGESNDDIGGERDVGDLAPDVVDAR